MKNNPKKQENTEHKEQEYLEGWKRARADLENLQKRMADSRAQEQTAIKRKIAESFIALSDNFHALTDHAPDTKDPWVTGVLHVARQFDQTLQEFGVEMISDTLGKFDPNIHEAVEEVEGEEEPGTIVELVQAGYKIGEMVIRPAKVKVTAWQSSRPGDKDPGTNEDIQQPHDGPHPNPLPE